MTDDVDTIDEGDDGLPAKKPASARAWLALITSAERQLQMWQDKCDSIERLYANLDKLANSTRDREFQLFWANVQVLGPSIYSRPPVPVVVPRFKDRKPLVRVTSELLERSTVVAFEIEDIDAVMLAVRDDLNITARGAPWVRYETKRESDTKTERICVEHVDRKDFLHDPARKWKEVDWVGRRSWLTRAQAKKRFFKESGKAYQNLAYAKSKNDDGADDGQLKAPVWEIWSKSQNVVVWVGEGCETILDQDEPHLKLEGFFPCPRPAYATVQPRSLIPVPDAVFYKDQLEEINETTARIAALTEAIKVAGFYPAGAGEIADAVEAAAKSTDTRATLIPISNWAALGGGGAKDMVVWWPIGDVATVVVQLIEIRKQLIDDVYQIMGLSDIMRGSTEASETATAQSIKAQWGSVRIRDKQSELVRIARDLTRIASEIMAENFQAKTLLEMSQLEIPSNADIAKQAKPLEQQARQIQAEIEDAQRDPEIAAMASQNPEQAQKIIQQAHGRLQELAEQINKLRDTVTIEKVMEFLRDQRIRPFVLDIETDSTIAPDEDAQKQRATEFVTAVGGAMAQAAPLLQQMPQAGQLLAETLKYLASQFRAGRQLEQEIEAFADGLKQIAGQPKPPDPATVKAQAEAQAAQMAAQTEQAKADADLKDRELARQERAMDMQSRAAEEAAKAETRRMDMLHRGQEAALKQQALEEGRTQAALKHAQDMEIGALQMDKIKFEIGRAQVQTDATIAKAQAGLVAHAAGMQQEAAEAAMP